MVVSLPSSRRDWEKVRSILILVTIRWPSRAVAWDEVRLDHVNTHVCNILFSAGPIPVLAKPTGEEHPTPDSVPARKSSIIQGGFLTLTCPDV